MRRVIHMRMSRSGLSFTRHSFDCYRVGGRRHDFRAPGGRCGTVGSSRGRMTWCRFGLADRLDLEELREDFSRLLLSANDPSWRDPECAAIDSGTYQCINTQKAR
jgi:hypothetical protein